MNARLAPAVCLALFAALLAGCGGASEPATTTHPSSTPPVASAATAVPPVSDRAIGPDRLRQLIVSGVAADFREGTGAGPRGFGLCLRLGLRRSLDNAALQRLALTYSGPSGQQLAAQALNALAAPAGARCGGKRFVPELVEASRALGSGHLKIGQSGALGLVYGPYVGIANCPRPNSTRCAAIGFDMVLKHRALTASAEIAGRSVPLQTPGPIPHNAGAPGRDWGGYLANVDLEARDSPFHIPGNGRPRGFWAGQPPVYLPIQITITRPSGQRTQVTLPRVRLSPGFG
jgi:hypothetical protein